MSSVCEVCGSASRPGAMFCSGCTARLPAFRPTGPSALQAMQDIRSPLDRGAVQTRTPMVSARVVRSSPSYFWQGLSLLVLGMAIVFAVWFAVVTRKAEAPARPRSDETMMSTAAPASTPPAAPIAMSKRPSDDAPLAPARSAPVAPAVALNLPPSRGEGAPTVDAATAAAPGAAPGRALGPQSTDRIEQRQARLRRAAGGRTTEPRQAPWVAEAEPTFSTAPAPVAAPWPVTVARAQADSGPPIAPGPGPLYGGSASRASPSVADPGPPVVAGPGPLYDTPRTPVRAPTWAVNDPGPPIAVGPGPQVDSSPWRNRSR